MADEVLVLHCNLTLVPTCEIRYKHKREISTSTRNGKSFFFLHLRLCSHTIILMLTLLVMLVLIAQVGTRLKSLLNALVRYAWGGGGGGWGAFIKR